VPLQSLVVCLAACGRPLTFGEWSLATTASIRYPDSEPEFSKALQRFGYTQLRNMQRYAQNARCLGMMAPAPTGLAGEYMWTMEALDGPELFLERFPAKPTQPVVAEDKLVVNGWSYFYAFEKRWIPQAGTASSLG
jgi:hypothetical protein